MAPDPLRNVVFVVTGSNLTAEQKDRPLAYFLKTQIDRYGGEDESKCAVVVSDLWYAATAEARKRATISVGGPGVNNLSRELWPSLPTALAVDNVFAIQMDVSMSDLRASIWGMDHETTKEAVQTFFEKGYLRRFLEAVWGEELEHLEEKPAKKD